MRNELKSESAANDAMARAAVSTIARKMAHESERAEWRRMLERRDAKRAHRSRRNARRSNPRNAYGRASIAATLITAVVAIGAALLRTFA